MQKNLPRAAFFCIQFFCLSSIRMGRFFEEKVYQEAIVVGLRDARTEVRIDVTN
jgi:hypothetical protein